MMDLAPEVRLGLAIGLALVLLAWNLNPIHYQRIWSDREMIAPAAATRFRALLLTALIGSACLIIDALGRHGYSPIEWSLAAGMGSTVGLIFLTADLAIRAVRRRTSATAHARITNR